ncbi:MAG TPA: fatty acid desaturase [Xanthobacteraceae bacterium]|nr:fatty acid desaturase [Xanthobacteraceae bacterium]
MSSESAATLRGDIPGRLNLALLAGAIVLTGGCLHLASNGGLLALRIGAAIAFSFFNNTMFSLMHEAVHGVFHRNATVNELAGRLAAGFFPTALSLQRAFHLAHHRNNRGDCERFDFYAPGENRVLKFAQWYCILTGLYWIASPLFCLVYAATAGLVPWTKLLAPDDRLGRQTSAEPFLNSLRGVSPMAARVDVATSIAIQAALIYFLHLDVLGWVLCYACFAVNWSSLQYTDHAFSALDRQEGAWNLRVNPIVRLIFLNYHHHLAHHRHPGAPWTELPGLVRAGDPNPSFWSVYWRMWAGPRPLPGKNPERA